MAAVVGTTAGTGTLLDSLASSTHTFLQPPSSLHVESLASLKWILDPLATNIADAQKSRRDESRKKRKRGDVEREEEVLQLRQVYTSGLGVKQVWEQAKRVLDAACSEIEKDLVARQSLDQANAQGLNGLNGHLVSQDEASEDLDTEEAPDDEIDEDDLSGDVDLNDSDLEEQDEDEDDEFEDELDDIVDEEDSASGAEPENQSTYVQDPNNLNDGFFSIDEFNKQTQFLEQMDALGEDDNPSDEEEIDWDADPLKMPYHKPKRQQGSLAADHDDASHSDDASDEENGPTFGNADLGADDSDEEMLDGGDANDLGGALPGLDNTNEIRYADFFAPPPKKPSKTKRMRALPKTQPAAQPQPEGEDDYEEDMQRAISDVRRDLLESDEEISGSESGSDDDSKPSAKNMSTHERQRAAIAAEIRRLEAANVAKRDWTLSGEARAAERPLNSLIEEDLEFERVGKPVPVITTEVSEEIEQLIKRRILAREFDEVVRRHPDALGAAHEARRGRIDLDDTKPQSGLAEVYEQEHLRATDPGYVDKRSAATKKQHEEISRLWKEVSSQLDLLSNLHFKPKRVEAEIKTVEDKPTISMEDARPVGLGVNADQSMLAPQEVYRPGEDKTDRDLVVRKSGMSVNKEEMTREEKLRRRRREKERTKKAQAQGKAPVAGSAASGAPASRKKKSEQEKTDILTELRKGNVKVIDKKGELQDLGGKKRKGEGRGTAVESSGGAFKL